MSGPTKAIFGKRALQSAFAEDYIDWAGELLVQDYDSPSLRILAGLHRRSGVFEVEAYFLRALKELNISEPESKAAVRAYACEIAHQIIIGQLTSQEGVRTLYRICRDTEFDHAYLIWYKLDDALDSLLASVFPYSYQSATLDNFDAIVRKEAEEFLAAMKLKSAS
jgi:hypothetical protein